MSKKTRILITGASGQLGENLIDYFSEHSDSEIIATDLNSPTYSSTFANESLDVLNHEVLRNLVQQYDVDQVYHLAALLSASGEQSPLKAWDINMQGLLYVLESAKEFKLRVFWPSSIAVFGETTPKHMTPQKVITEPSTAYGISKVAGELWCNYYFNKFDVDVRSVRFPGLISWKGDPGGGTTDYAVEIFHEALQNKRYTCFLRDDAYLPMLYMDDAIAGIVQLMAAPKEQVKQRDSYNISGMSFSPAELAYEIKQHIPEFTINYAPDFRQQIAESWPASIEDLDAQTDWGWKPRFDLKKMTATILSKLTEELEPTA